MHLYINNFHFICIVQEKKEKNSTHLEPKIKSINKNEGSHTRVINYLSTIETNIKVLQLKNFKQRNRKREIRYVWLETSVYTNITFARSLWTMQTNKNFIEKLEKKVAIGPLFINNRSDIHKEIIESYVCYCKDLEKKLRFSGIIWGRKYTLGEKNNPHIVIQEFFSPNLIFFLTTFKSKQETE